MAEELNLNFNSHQHGLMYVGFDTVCTHNIIFNELHELLNSRNLTRSQGQRIS